MKEILLFFCLICSPLLQFFFISCLFIFFSIAPVGPKGITLDAWLISALSTRLGTAIDGDEALDLAHRRISDKRRNSLSQSPPKVCKIRYYKLIEIISIRNIETLLILEEIYYIVSSYYFLIWLILIMILFVILIPLYAWFSSFHNIS